jgi:hypothetical protein
VLLVHARESVQHVRDQHRDMDRGTAWTALKTAVLRVGLLAEHLLASCVDPQ